MSKKITGTITASYASMYVLYFGASAVDGVNLQPGRARVSVQGETGLTAEGSMNLYGGVSGMSKIYKRLGLIAGDTVEATVVAPNEIVITGVSKQGVAVTAPAPVAPATVATGSVFQRQSLKAIHFELFRPQNLNDWEPENEPDVYMAFGVLQEYTEYRYCCSTSASLLSRLGYTAATKPDAVLVSADTDQYMIAEFKMNSAHFKGNHQPGDVDVLVVWTDDETDRSKLPPNVVCLRDIAKKAAQELLNS